MIIRHRFIAASLLMLLVIVAMAPSLAQGPRQLSIVTGRGELLQFERDIERLGISEPKIADAVLVSPREIMINGKAPGKTSLFVWDGGSAPQRYNVDVTIDNSESENSRKELQAGLPQGVVVGGNGDTMVLTGLVKDATEVKRIEGLAQARAKKVVNLLQTPPPPAPRQILLQVKFAAINRQALSQVGFNLFSQNGKLVGNSSTEQYAAPRVSQLLTAPGSTSQTVNFSDLLNLFVYRPDLNIGATIKALEQENLLQILAEPNLITLEGKEATFLAGGSFPFPVLTSTPTGGSIAPVITVQFKPYGVSLSFTPTVTNTGAIDLKVSPEVSSLDFTNAVTLQGFLIPALAQRKAETEVVLKDGESFAIAGLINNQVINELAKVKFLGDLPIIGYFFKSTSKQKTTDEMLVVITPHFVKPLNPDEKAKMPDWADTFLPTVKQEQDKKHKGKKDGGPPASPDQAEFTGPSGYQTPSK